MPRGLLAQLHDALAKPQEALALQPGHGRRHLCRPALVQELEPAMERHPSGAAFVEYVTDVCFRGDLLSMDKYGEPIKTPVPLSVKMEELLEVASHRRELHMKRLRDQGDWHRVSADMYMDDDA